MSTTKLEFEPARPVYYEVFVNGTSLGVFGHDAVKNMSLSVSRSAGTQDVFVSAVCEESGELFFYDWLQHPVGDDDSVEFRPSKSHAARVPRMRRPMQRSSAQQRAAGDSQKPRT